MAESPPLTADAATPASLSRPPIGSFGTLRMLLRYLWPVGQWGMRARVVTALLLLAAAKVSVVYIPVFYGRAVDALSPGDRDLIVMLPLAAILAYGAARVLSLACGELRDAVFARVGQRAIRTVALEVFTHLHRLSLRFHLSRQTGGLSRSIERGTRAIEILMRFSLFSIIPTLLELSLVFVVMWHLLNLQLALITLGTVLIYIAYTMVVTEWRTKFRRQMNAEDNRANTKAIDSLLNYETVKYFGNEAHEHCRLDDALQGYERAAVKNQVSLSLLNIGQSLIISAGLTAVMYLTALGIISGELSVGDFVMANTYLLQLYQPLGFFGFVYREIKQALVDIEKMFELLHEPLEVRDDPSAARLEILGAAVTFRDVHFGYDSRRAILEGVSFDVPAGKTVAIVGASGAGKSTLSRLLYRFYDPSQGVIEIDGQDIRRVSQDSLRAAIGIVPQDTVLFNDTIFYNINYGRPEATPTEVEQAARLAQIHDYIMQFPDGYQTIVGERGLKLSGGEKQRVAIARTIVKNPRILIFDEATSALDSKTEREIQRNLQTLSKGRTTLCIAHRLSTVVDAHEILVMEGGQIVERGDHRHLLEAGGRYAQMWERQQQSEGDNGTEVELIPKPPSPGLVH